MRNGNEARWPGAGCGHKYFHNPGVPFLPLQSRAAGKAVIQATFLLGFGVLPPNIIPGLCILCCIVCLRFILFSAAVSRLSPSVIALFFFSLQLFQPYKTVFADEFFVEVNAVHAAGTAKDADSSVLRR